MAGQDSIALNEKEYFLRISGGDESAFSEIFYHYVPRLYSFIRKMTRSAETAEEIVQDVFLSLWNNRVMLTEIENPCAYIFTMATNKTFNYLKSKAIRDKYLHSLQQKNAESDNHTLEAIDFHESQQLIHKLVDQLPSQKKIIYKLTRDEGMTHDEVAVQLGISKNTVKNHLVETLKYLKKYLQKYKEVSVLFLGLIQ